MFENTLLSQNLMLSAVIIGIGATAMMDIWALFLKMTFNISGLNYALVGRWFGHLAKRKLIHQNIVTSSPITGELLIGWTAHYVIGIIFAATLLLLVGAPWAHSPSLLPALFVGLVTVTFPLFVIQPCFGMGIAATKLPKPHISQMKSLIAHSVFGFGLYFSALLHHQLVMTIDKGQDAKTVGVEVYESVSER
ncbi:DUF2938 domain-containing protein [Veronia pacifica]|uniref:DUF2938 domain-containing protein n=1 Tax=Veronia pacifica TaxID=1080227 RepID=A0A1C3EKY9_9GAMM|nr:DUF2938 domain-containing protein [Veronia pacifica]ODA33907.1 hypothetical protein A8L45_08820 [Veronia pacifica]